MDAPVPDAKGALRETALRARRALDDDERRDAATKVAARAVGLPEVRAALRELAGATGGDETRRPVTVLAYAAMADELDLGPLVQALRGRGARILFPRVRGPELDLAAAPDRSALVIGHRGVREPQGPAIDTDVVDLALVPGVAFDVHGARLGHGGGHYDRLLPRLPDTCVTVGVAFACQIVPRVPVESHDQRVDVVVTEAGAHRREGD